MSAGTRHGAAADSPAGPGRDGRAGAAALRERRFALRRPRRRDQHHPPPAAGAWRRSRAPRPQPQRRRHRAGGDPGRRRRHRLQFVPGRARRVLQLHGRHAARARRRTRPHRRRWRRHDRAARSRGTRSLRRRAHLYARGRPQARPRRHDRRCAGARAACAASRRSSSVRSGRATTSRSRARSPLLEHGGDRTAAQRDACAAPSRAARAKPPVVGITGTGRRRQVEPDRRTADAVRALTSRTATSPSWPWTRRGAAAAARCSAIASA